MSKDRKYPRTTFNKSAEWYDQIRPGYPEALINEVIQSGSPLRGNRRRYFVFAGQACGAAPAGRSRAHQTLIQTKANNCIGEIRRQAQRAP
jgi:hypothetical protein